MKEQGAFTLNLMISQSVEEGGVVLPPLNHTLPNIFLGCTLAALKFEAYVYEVVGRPGACVFE